MRRIATGLGVSPGIAVGKARIVKGAADHARFSQGDILIARITDPTMVVLMGKAGAIVCDIGGLTSHPAVVSREMGVPCIVATKGTDGGPATGAIRDGMRLRVDGENGTVEVDDAD